MLRNLGILKMALCRPTRSDQYRIGPCDVSRISNTTTRHGSAKITMATAARNRSSTRFVIKKLPASLSGLTCQIPVGGGLQPLSQAIRRLPAEFTADPAAIHAQGSEQPLYLPGIT